MSKWQAELTDKDREKIKYDQNKVPVYKWLIENKGMTYSEGDVLIKRSGWGSNSERSVEMISASINMPRKYVVQHVDALGIPYVRTICANGDLGKVLTCIANQADYNHYEHDPDVADHFLLTGDEEEYNPIQGLKALKQRKAAIRKLNKKKRVNFNDAMDFSKMIKKGDSFWMVDKPQMKELTEYQHTWIDMRQSKNGWGGQGDVVFAKDFKGCDVEIGAYRFEYCGYCDVYLEKPICELTGTVEDE